MRNTVGGVAQPLKQEQHEEVERIWKKYDGSVSEPNGNPPLGYDVLDEVKAHDVVVELPIGAKGGLVPIRGKDIDRMIPRRWLFDEAINSYMALLQIRTDRRRTLDEMAGGGTNVRAPSHFWGSFFIEKLKSCRRSAVRKNQMERMTDKVTSVQGDIFQLDKMAMPVNIAGGHWALIVAYMRERKLRSFDPMNGGHSGDMEMFLALFEAEAQRLDVDFDRSKWSTERGMGIPQQGNCSDCGVFLCAFASHVVDATDFPFAQQDMDSIRARITYELVQSTTPPPTLETTAGRPQPQILHQP